LAEMLQVEVLNFGVPGYSPDQAWLYYERDGVATGSCVVLIGHMLENIDRVVNRFRPFYYSETGIPLAKPRFQLDQGRLTLLPTRVNRPEDLKDAVWVERNLGPDDAWYFPGLFVNHPLDWLELVRLSRTAGYRISRGGSGLGAAIGSPRWQYQPGIEAFDVLVSVLAGFADRVKADGRQPIVLVFPHGPAIREQVAGGANRYSALADALERLQVPTLDLTDALVTQARQSGSPSLAAGDPDGHYSALGNEVVARTLAEKLPRLIDQPCRRST
jgi:hypothetical protein